MDYIQTHRAMILEFPVTDVSGALVAVHVRQDDAENTAYTEPLARLLK